MYMKRYLLFILLLLIPFIVYAEDSCNPNNIKIESIELKEKSDNVEENSEPISNGNSVNVDLKVNRVGDTATYELLVKNISDEDYEINKSSLSVGSDFVNYSLKTEDGDNIIKAGKSKVIYLEVKYANAVPEDKFDASGVYNDNKNVVVDLTNKGNALINPVTSTGIILLVIALGSVLIFIIVKKTKVKKYMVLLIPFILIIPYYVYAICKCEIKVESNVVVEKLFTGTVYRNNDFHLKNGESFLQKTVWCIARDSECLLNDEGVRYISLFKDTCEEDILLFSDTSIKCLETKVTLDEYNFLNEPKENWTYYLKHEIKDNIVKKTYVCYKYNNQEYCLKDNTNDNFYEDNKTMLKDSLGESKCNDIDTSTGENVEPGYRCVDDIIRYHYYMYDYYTSHNNGDVSVFIDCIGACGIDKDGNSWCSIDYECVL